MRASRTRTWRTANAAATTKGLGNRFLIPLLTSRVGGLLGHWLAVVEYSGRRTGQSYQLVAAYIAQGRTVRITVGMAEHKTWWRNFETPHRLRLRLAGVDHDALAHVVAHGDRVSVVAELLPPRGLRGDAVSLGSATQP